MPRQNGSTPSYLLHRASGQARVRINGRDFYLGPHGSPASKEKYARLLAEHFSSLATGTAATLPDSGSGVPLTITELVDRYDDFARSYYVKDGEFTDSRYRAGVGPLVELYGSSLARDFGPLKLQAVRERIIARGNQRRAGRLCRKYVNAMIQALVRMFKWGASQELIPASVHDALLKVDGLRKGKESRVQESEPVTPVPEEHVRAVVAVASPQIAAIIQVQLLTGARPDEITIIRPCDIDRSDATWSYRPNSHKLEFHELGREILLGPQAQKVLLPWLEGRDPNAYLFSPREVAEANALALERRRKKPNGKKVKVSSKRPPRDHYDDRGYRQAVVRACERAGVPPWTPGQLRHNAGTIIRKEYGAEAAQIVLGHQNLSTTEIYAERDRAKYLEIIRQIG